MIGHMPSSSPHPADRHDLIRVQGARENNLKDVSVEIPKRRLTVFTGVSGFEKRQNRAETAQARADMMQGLKTLFGSGTTDPATTGGTTTTPRPSRRADPCRRPHAAGSPAGDDPGGPHGSGTTTVASNTLDAARQAIASVESGGSRDPYSAVGPATRSGDRAYGFAQVMGNNVGPWTEQYFGQRLSPGEFLRNPAAQEAVFRGRFGEYLERTGNVRDAASLWFTGRPYAQAAAAGANDGYNSVQQYVAKVERALGTQAPAPSGAPQTAFAPTVAPAPTPAAQAATAAPQAPLPTAEALPAGHAQVQQKYEPLIFRALNRGDNGEVARLSAQRDAEMQAARGALGTGRVADTPAARQLLPAPAWPGSIRASASAEAPSRRLCRASTSAGPCRRSAARRTARAAHPGRCRAAYCASRCL